jgi:hypothetical protein
MKNKIIYLFTLAFLLSVYAKAQQPNQRIQKTPEQRAASISKDLGISRDKALELVMTMQAVDQRISALMKDTLMNRGELHQRLRELSTEKRAIVNAILTPEQQQKMQSIIRQRNAEQFARIEERQREARKAAMEREARPTDNSRNIKKN